MPPRRRLKNRDAAFTRLRKLIENSPHSLFQLAEQAGVKYSPLQKWMKGSQRNYSLLDGERVYHFLTGKTFFGDGA